MALAIKNLCKSYPGIQIFDGLDMDVQENKITCILGPYGIGKTTLLNIISGITTPDSGNISDFEGKDFSYIFQEPRLLYWKTVYENISFVLKDAYNEKELQSRVNRYLEIVGLFKFRNILQQLFDIGDGLFNLRLPDLYTRINIAMMLDDRLMIYTIVQIIWM